MICYTMLRVLFEYEKYYIPTLNGSQTEFINLLTCHDVYFIPVVNLDGFHEIQKYWNQDETLKYIRKNMRPQKEPECS